MSIKPLCLWNSYTGFKQLCQNQLIRVGNHLKIDLYEPLHRHPRSPFIMPSININWWGVPKFIICECKRLLSLTNKVRIWIDQNSFCKYFILTLYLCFLWALCWKHSIQRTHVGSIPQSLKDGTKLLSKNMRNLVDKKTTFRLLHVICKKDMNYDCLCIRLSYQFFKWLTPVTFCFRQKNLSIHNLNFLKRTITSEPVDNQEIRPLTSTLAWFISPLGRLTSPSWKNTFQ